MQETQNKINIGEVVNHLKKFEIVTKSDWNDEYLFMVTGKAIINPLMVMASNEMKSTPTEAQDTIYKKTGNTCQPWIPTAAELFAEDYILNINSETVDIKTQPKEGQIWKYKGTSEYVRIYSIEFSDNGPKGTKDVWYDWHQGTNRDYAVKKYGRIHK